VLRETAAHGALKRARDGLHCESTARQHARCGRKMMYPRHVLLANLQKCHKLNLSAGVSIRLSDLRVTRDSVDTFHGRL
jgi:hypothetical protein